MFQARAVEDALTAGFDNADYATICQKIAEIGFPAETEEELIGKITSNQQLQTDGGSKLQDTSTANGGQRLKNVRMAIYCFSLN